MIGGALAKPVDNLPSIFLPGSLWDRFPYLLPNLFSAICVSLGVVIGLLFLEETHAEKKKQRDRGVELGNYLLSRLPGRSSKAAAVAKDNDEEQPLLSDSEDPLPGYLTNGPPAGLPPASSSSERGPIGVNVAGTAQGLRLEAKPAAARIFTKPVVTIIASYGLLAL
jgi:hypothetical protein